jgi:hypothetical protein
MIEGNFISQQFSNCIDDDDDDTDSVYCKKLINFFHQFLVAHVNHILSELCLL